MISKIIDKIFDKAFNPFNFNIIIATFLTSLTLLITNFLPSIYLKKLHLKIFLDDYGYIVLIVFVASLFLLLIYGSASIEKKIKDKKRNGYIKEQQNKLFKDNEALAILKELYSESPEAVYLSIYNQKVKLLEQFFLITKATNQAMVDMSNPRFPYILQPIAEEKLNKLSKKGD